MDIDKVWLADRIRVVLEKAKNTSIQITDAGETLAEITTHEFAYLRKLLSEPPRSDAK